MNKSIDIPSNLHPMQHQIVSTAFAIDGTIYAFLSLCALFQLLRHLCRYRPWLIQKAVHVLVFLAALLRSIFLFLVSLDWCDVLSGKVQTSACTNGEKELFYITDQLPIVLYFINYAILIQFWAEVYYSAVNQLRWCTKYIRPSIRFIILIITCLQILFWVFYVSAWQKERAFFTKSQAILNMIMFLITTIGLLYYARKAYVELQFVPVELGIRSRKLRELAFLTTICTTCFLTRSSLQIYLATERRQLQNSSAWMIVILYYVILEVLPTISILYFNRRLPPRSRGYNYKGNIGMTNGKQAQLREKLLR